MIIYLFLRLGPIADNIEITVFAAIQYAIFSTISCYGPIARPKLNDCARQFFSIESDDFDGIILKGVTRYSNICYF